MTTTGVIFKRCGCRDNGRRLESVCPRLADRGHGTWYSTAPPRTSSAAANGPAAAATSRRPPPATPATNG